MTLLPSEIVVQKPQTIQSHQRSPQKSQRKQPSRYNHTAQGRSRVEASPYLQIQSIPITERINPREPRYILVILPQRVRAFGGQFIVEEAHAIAKATRHWDWSLDENKRPRCLPALEALLDNICKRSAVKESMSENFSQSSLPVSVLWRGGEA